MGPVGLVVVVSGMTMFISPTKFYEYFALVGCNLPEGVAPLFVPGSQGMLGTAPLTALVAWIV